MTADRTVLPPVRLPAEAELAREALASPLFARAVRLARWAGPGLRVGAGGELPDAEVREAAAELGLEESADEEGEARAVAGEAWRIAVDVGLVDVTAPEEGDEELGTAAPSADLRLVTGGAPADVLELWAAACECVLSDAALPDMSALVEQITAGEELDLDRLDWDPEADADFLDGALANLYLLTAMEGPGADGAVPLPALAASLVVPDDMDEPTEEVLAEVSEAVLRLDEQFRMLEPVGVVAYRPVAEEILLEAAGTAPAADGPEDGAEDEDVSRYGVVRLTPLGLYALRRRMLAEGLVAPLVGELAGEDAYVLLDALPRLPDQVAHTEAEAWLEDRKPAEAATELLDAARGTDDRAPARRLACQQALAVAGGEAEPAVRDVLHDRELGGLARVWLTERGVPGVPQPTEDMVFWLAVDTVAAQLGGLRDDTPELRELVEHLVGMHRGFFAAAWRVDHPATPEVLEAMGRLHPDRQVAKDARKAAFKARSRPMA
ncbi:hypothetical protein OG946_06800 [Streptomyces sp. NBC_01808]|uniref:hypothetical protein n=1 Tax=Streptomyces sp. NBC_01808 TaxID=2975947 RepID=UPI002DD8B80F|nr:hypothetical protein [Streptomyces sp. NBC_01808]WSA37110.1 hypothetical protein OG946_06800 [Streptomyces sp. NBC_01808]